MHAPKILIVWLLLILVWEAGFRLVGWRPWLFPAPSHVLDSALDLMNVHTAFGEPLHAGWPRPAQSYAPQGKPPSTFLASPLPRAVAISGVRLVTGFLISLVLGCFVGLFIWRFTFLDALLGPVLLGFQTLPSVCWVPLAVLTLGINESSIVFVLVMGSVFAIAIALRDGLRQTPPIYTRAAVMLGARRWRLFVQVLLPAALPAAAGALRQGFSFAWRSLMGGELVFMLPNRGLGFLLNVGREFADVAQVVAVMLIMVLIGTFLDRLVFARLELRIRTRFGLV